MSALLVLLKRLKDQRHRSLLFHFVSFIGPIIHAFVFLSLAHACARTHTHTHAQAYHGAIQTSIFGGLLLGPSRPPTGYAVLGGCAGPGKLRKAAAAAAAAGAADQAEANARQFRRPGPLAFPPHDGLPKEPHALKHDGTQERAREEGQGRHTVGRANRPTPAAGGGAAPITNSGAEASLAAAGPVAAGARHGRYLHS